MEKNFVIETEANVVIDALNYVWFRGDVQVLIGKVSESNMFISTQNMDLSTRLLRVIADLIELKVVDSQR
jgi:hypothetical protein